MRHGMIQVSVLLPVIVFGDPGIHKLINHDKLILVCSGDYGKPWMVLGMPILCVIKFIGFASTIIP